MSPLVPLMYIVFLRFTMLIPDNFVKNKENVSQSKLMISSTFFLICVCLGCVCAKTTCI